MTSSGVSPSASFAAANCSTSRTRAPLITPLLMARRLCFGPAGRQPCHGWRSALSRVGVKHPPPPPLPPCRTGPLGCPDRRSGRLLFRLGVELTPQTRHTPPAGGECDESGECF